MVLPPPLNLPAPTPGTFPGIQLGSGGSAPPTTPGSGSLEYRIVLRNQIREEMMTDTIRAILTKRGSNQTLTGNEPQLLQAWEDQVEQEYSRRLNIAVPADTQQRLEQLEKLLDGEGRKALRGGGGEEE